MKIGDNCSRMSLVINHKPNAYIHEIGKSRVFVCRETINFHDKKEATEKCLEVYVCAHSLLIFRACSCLVVAWPCGCHLPYVRTPD
jgi:hypothetical protein